MATEIHLSVNPNSLYLSVYCKEKIFFGSSFASFFLFTFNLILQGKIIYFCALI